MLSKKENIHKNKKGVNIFGNSISFQEKKYNFQSVLAKRTILNVQSSKYNSTYFYVNYEIIHMILLKIKRGKSF